MGRNIMAAGILLLGQAMALAEDPSGKPPASQGAPATAESVAVAVLDYEGALPGNPELGKQIADILTARLSIEDAFTLVERAKLGNVLAEHGLALRGLVDPDKAAQVGKLTGAKLLVLGKAFLVDKSLMMMTKVVGVETGQLKGTIRQVDMNKPLSEAIMLLAEDVAGVIKKDADKLLPKDAALTDPVARLRKALAGKKMPRVAVVIPEQHHAQPAAVRPVLDPAVETEIKKTLISCGLSVVDTGQNDLADWAKRMMRSDRPPWPPALDQADYVIIGEGFSEFALRSGDLVSCAGRAEINVIDRKTGTIVLADRATARAVDLAEAVAGKTALQKAGRTLAVAILKHFADTLPAAEPAGR